MRSFTPFTFLLLVLFCLMSLSFDKKEYNCRISGRIQIDDKYVRKVFIQYVDRFASKRIIDSASVVNGKYQFNLTITHPWYAFLQISYRRAEMLKDSIKIPEPEQRVFGLMLDKSKISVNTSSFIFSESNAKGSPANEEYIAYKKITAPWQEKREKYYTVRDSLEKNSLYAEQIRDSIYSTYLQEINLITASISKKKKLKILHEIIYDVTTSWAYYDREALKKFLDVAKQKGADEYENYHHLVQAFTMLNQPTKSFSRLDQQDKMVNLEDYRGKYLLLEFWGSWCKPCRETFPGLKRIYQQFNPKGFEILGLAKDNKETMMKAITDDGIPWNNVLLSSDQDELEKSYAVRSYPSNFLIDPAGKLIAIKLDTTQLKKQLQKLIGQ